MVNTKSPNSNRVVNLEKQEARETWHKLFVKITSWRDGLVDGTSIDPSNKITPKEWKTYCEHILEKNVTYGKQKNEEMLKVTKELITKYGGFSK